MGTRRRQVKCWKKRHPAERTEGDRQLEAQRGLRETGGEPGLGLRTSGPRAQAPQAAVPRAPAAAGAEGLEECIFLEDCLGLTVATCLHTSPCAYS